jgi:hypothetical protein
MDKPQPTDVTSSLLQVLERASRDTEWWRTDMATLVIDLAEIRPFVSALAGIAELLREGEDPLWVVGGITPAAAFAVTHEWLNAGIAAEEVGGWIRAGCWDPKAARRLVDVGLRPPRLLDEHGKPAHWTEVTNGDHMPLASAVADSFLTPEQAVQVVVRP